MKVTLERRRHQRGGHVRRAAPFFVVRRTGRVHRVRAASTHMSSTFVGHMAISLWCGQGTFGSRGDFVFSPPVGLSICDKCDTRHARAVRNGHVG